MALLKTSLPIRKSKKWTIKLIEGRPSRRQILNLKNHFKNILDLESSRNQISKALKKNRNGIFTRNEIIKDRNNILYFYQKKKLNRNSI